MDKVVSVNTEDFDATVQPGVTRKGINSYMRDLGVWFPVGMFLHYFYPFLLPDKAFGCTLCRDGGEGGG